MSDTPATPQTPERVLRRLFMTLFLRGRSSRGLHQGGAPTTVAQKLGLALLIYMLVGLFALAFLKQTVFMLSLQLHAMSFVFLGMFIASSAGEILFNKEEADILMHRPITPRAMLWAKITVLVQVSLWLAGALNLVGFFVGAYMQDGGWLYPLAHVISTVLQALFCAGSVVVVYQLCLRWFGRERLDGMMTTAQVIVAVAAVGGGQLLPQLIGRGGTRMNLTADTWWVALMPPAWFASFDDVIAGHGTGISWVLAAGGVLATAAVLWLAFGKLAHDYEMGLQTLNETVAPKKSPRAQRRWLDVLVHAPPLCWWLRNHVARASFLLTAAYLVRDRDVKLRIYPGLAPMLMMPVIFLLQETRNRSGVGFSGFGIAYSGAYIGLIPLMALNMLQYSQHWQASDLFRAAPMAGPMQLCHGARRAVLLFLTLPLIIVLGVVAWLLGKGSANLPLLLPGLIALPLYALIPCIGGRAVPLSMPTEEAKSAGRGVSMFAVMMASLALAGVALWAKSGGWLGWFLLVEGVVVGIAYVVLRVILERTPWSSME